MAECARCDTDAELLGRGLCTPCYHRAWKVGELEGYPKKGVVRVHGSLRGYRQHRRFNEDACEECMEAMRADSRERYRRREGRRMRGGLVCGICGVPLSEHSIRDACFRGAA